MGFVDDLPYVVIGGVLLLFASVKAATQVQWIIWLFGKGGRQFVYKAKQGPGPWDDELTATYNRARPVENWIQRHIYKADAPDHTNRERMCSHCRHKRKGVQLFQISYRTWVVVSAASFFVLIADPSNVDPGWLHLCFLILAVTSAFCVLLQIAIGVLRRLAIGSRDAYAEDLQIPGSESLRDWALFRLPASNLSVYFMVLLWISVVGFSALYSAMYHFDPGVFRIRMAHMSALGWLYFSVETVSTVGYGDVTPASSWGQAAVLAQLSSGPLFIAFLVSAFLSREPAI